MTKLKTGDYVKITKKTDKWFGRVCEVISIEDGNINPKTFQPVVTVEVTPTDAVIRENSRIFHLLEVSKL